MRLIVDFAHTLGLTVTAKGVENDRRVASLMAMRCDMVQGFHYSRPLGGGQDDARPAHRSLSTARPSRHVLERLALTIREHDRPSPWSWHDVLDPFRSGF
jgi:hypothetical protein